MLADLQEEVILIQSMQPLESVDCGQKAHIHRRTTSCVYPDPTASSDEQRLLCRTLAASSSLHFPTETPEQCPVSDPSQTGTDVFQLAPFKKTPVKRNKLPLTSLRTESPDVFTQAPFVRKQNPVPASECLLYPGGALRPPDAPVLQQPVSVHRVVSRVGQQAAVGSVAVGPLHAWTVAGRPTDDPFTAAPFNPRCSQERL